MNTWISSLVKDYSIDGIRIDAAKHIRKDFWPDFVKAAGVFSIGEVSYSLFLSSRAHISLTHVRSMIKT